MHSSGSNLNFWNLLRSHHRVIPEVYVLNNQRSILGVATGKLLSGTVDMDATADVTRSAKLSILDPYNSIGLDFSGTVMGGAYFNRMVQIIYTIESFDRTQRYSCPIFTGPIVDANKSGVTVDIECEGMEHFALDPLLNDSQPGLAGWSRASTIMNAMTVHAGESYYRDETGGWQGLGAAWSMARGEAPWTRLKELAEAAGIQLYYDGNGTCVMRVRQTYPSFTLDNSWLTSDPDPSFDSSLIRNVVRVEGANAPAAGGGQAKITYEAWPAPQHPFSPQSLSRNGFPRVMAHLISDDGLASFPDVINAAWANLEADLMASGGATATSVVIPFLEEGDVVEYNTPKLFTNSALQKWTIPLVGDAEMSINTFSSTSSGFVGRSVSASNAAVFGGRWNQPGFHHGPSGGYSSWGNYGNKDPYGNKWSPIDQNGNGFSAGGKGGKKKNKNKGRKGKGR